MFIKVREAMSLLQHRLDMLTTDEQASLTPLLWMHLRDDVQRPFEWQRLRRAVRNGSFLLDAVERALDSTLETDSLTRAAAGVTTMVKSNPDKAGLVNLANNELTIEGPDFLEVGSCGHQRDCPGRELEIAHDVYEYLHPQISH